MKVYVYAYRQRIPTPSTNFLLHKSVTLQLKAKVKKKFIEINEQDLITPIQTEDLRYRPKIKTATHVNRKA